MRGEKDVSLGTLTIIVYEEVCSQGGSGPLDRGPISGGVLEICKEQTRHI